MVVRNLVDSSLITKHLTFSSTSPVVPLLILSFQLVMMASFMSYFGARRDPKQSARDAIVGLRQQLQMIEKKEEYLQKKIDEEMKKARANAVSNKPGLLNPVLPFHNG